MATGPKARVSRLFRRGPTLPAAGPINPKRIQSRTGTLEAFPVIANSVSQDGVNLAADTQDHLAYIASKAERRSISVDGVLRKFSVSTFRGEQIAVGRMPGNVTVSVTARGIPIESIELAVVDLADYGIDSAGPMSFHLDRDRTPALYA